MPKTVQNKPWSLFEFAILSSLYRIEQRQVAILDGVRELLSEGPNDQTLPARLAQLTDELNEDAARLKLAVQSNQSPI